MRMKRPALRAALLALTVVVAVSSAAAREAGSSGDSSRVRECTTAQLTVRVTRWLLGTTHTGGYVAFTNHSRSACRLSGWRTLAGPAMAAAGIPRVGPTQEKRTFHSFRHTFAKRAPENGAQSPGSLATLAIRH